MGFLETAKNVARSAKKTEVRFRGILALFHKNKIFKLDFLKTLSSPDLIFWILNLHIIMCPNQENPTVI